MKRAWKTFLVAFAVAAASLTSATSASAAPIISVAPSTTDVAQGDSFTLEVNITDAVGVTGYQFSLGFDPSILSVTNFADGDFFAASGEGPFFLGSTIDNVAGTVTFIAALLLQPEFGVSGDGVLATLEFTALNAGTSSVTPYFDAANGDFLADINFLPIDDTGFGGARVNVAGDTSVPEPVSVLTLALGLGTALARRRRHAGPLTNR